MVHNLPLMEWTETPFEWASAFDRRLKGLIVAGDHKALIHYEDFGKDASLAIPTNEHYLPMLYALSLQGQGEGVRFFAENVTLGSISMRSFVIS